MTQLFLSDKSQMEDIRQFLGLKVLQMEKSELVQITRQSKIAEDEFQPFLNGMYEQVWENLLPPQILTHNLSNTVTGNIITPDNKPIPDCLTCGACCASFVCVTLESDNAVASKDYWEITKQSENGEFTVDRCIKRREEDFSCTALEGKIGGNVSCRIYENRPKMCRTFEAGSDRCRAVRRAYNIEPFLEVMEMYEATRKLKSQEVIVDEERIEKVSINEESGTRNLQISVILKNGSEEVIHVFDPKSETWFQAEFEGLKLAEAVELIENR